MSFASYFQDVLAANREKRDVAAATKKRVALLQSLSHVSGAAAPLSSSRAEMMKARTGREELGFKERTLEAETGLGHRELRLGESALDLEREKEKKKKNLRDSLLKGLYTKTGEDEEFSGTPADYLKDYGF